MSTLRSIGRLLRDGWLVAGVALLLFVLLEGALSLAFRARAAWKGAESAGVVSGAAMLALLTLTPLSRWLSAGAEGFGVGLPDLPRAGLALVIFVILIVVAWELAVLPAMLYLGLRVDRRFANSSIAVEDVLAAQAHATLVALPAALVAGIALMLSVWIAGTWWWALAGALLARAHTRSLHPQLLAGYFDEDDDLDEAIGRFAVRYADQTEADHAKLVASRS